MVTPPEGLGPGRGAATTEELRPRIWEAFEEDEAGVRTPLERGTWGGSESGAEHVDDERFAGPGVLVVRHDTIARATILLIY